MSDWLYPLSASSGRSFYDSTGKRLGDTGFESFRQMMASPSTDDWWYLATNFRRVDIGDRVWCYYGSADGDVGVVGVARIREIAHDWDEGAHDIHVGWMKAATRRLIRQPVPAPEVRTFLPKPRSAVQALDPHPRLVARLKKAAGI